MQVQRIQNNNYNTNNCSSKVFSTKNHQKFGNADISRNNNFSNLNQINTFDKYYYTDNLTNINFKGNTILPLLHIEEYNKLLGNVLKKAEELGIDLMTKTEKERYMHCSQYDLYLYYQNCTNYDGPDVFALQAIDKLMNHPIINIVDVKKHLPDIFRNLNRFYNKEPMMSQSYGKQRYIDSSPATQMYRAEQLIDFANFLTSEEAKPLMEHPSMQKRVHDLLMENSFLCLKSKYLLNITPYIPYNFCRQVVAEELVKRPGLLKNKDYDFAGYLSDIFGLNRFERYYPFDTIYIRDRNNDPREIRKFNDYIRTLKPAFTIDMLNEELGKRAKGYNI